LDSILADAGRGPMPENRGLLVQKAYFRRVSSGEIGCFGQQ